MKEHVIIFVEGETEKVFYEHLIRYYKENSTTALLSVQVHNIKGFGNFKNKMISKLKNNIIPNLAKQQDRIKSVCCCYDTDVFDYAAIPPINWKEIKKEVQNLKIGEFVEVKANKMLEDWFLSDIEGLCKFLKLRKIPSLSGKDGNTKMKNLFKMDNKIYKKGTYCYKFIDNLDIPQIRNLHSTELIKLETAIAFKP